MTLKLPTLKMHKALSLSSSKCLLEITWTCIMHEQNMFTNTGLGMHTINVNESKENNAERYFRQGKRTGSIMDVHLLEKRTGSARMMSSPLYTMYLRK